MFVMRGQIRFSTSHIIPVDSTGMYVNAVGIEQVHYLLEMLMELKVGHKYKTRGGWAAQVIWVSNNKLCHDLQMGELVVIHQPGTEKESSPIWHYADGRVFGPCGLTFGLKIPDYGCKVDHPTDLIEEL